MPPHTTNPSFFGGGGLSKSIFSCSSRGVCAIIPKLNYSNAFFFLPLLLFFLPLLLLLSFSSLFIPFQLPSFSFPFSSSTPFQNEKKLHVFFKISFFFILLLSIFCFFLKPLPKQPLFQTQLSFVFGLFRSSFLLFLSLVAFLKPLFGPSEELQQSAFFKTLVSKSVKS